MNQGNETSREGVVSVLRYINDHEQILTQLQLHFGDIHIDGSCDLAFTIVEQGLENLIRFVFKSIFICQRASERCRFGQSVELYCVTIEAYKIAVELGITPDNEKVMLSRTTLGDGDDVIRYLIAVKDYKPSNAVLHYAHMYERYNLLEMCYEIVPPIGCREREISFGQTLEWERFLDLTMKYLCKWKFKISLNPGYPVHKHNIVMIFKRHENIVSLLMALSPYLMRFPMDLQRHILKFYSPYAEYLWNDRMFRNMLNLYNRRC